MTKHERIILEKLTENPMLSQNELADMLNITRSSVSVYISRLMQDGYIRGRGYVLEDQKSIIMVGTAGIDYRTVLAEDTVLLSDATTVLDDYELTVYYGGIAKNISDNLYRFGHDVSCISAIGSDVLGTELLNECKRTGINVSDMLIVPAARSSTYLELRSLDSSRVLLSSANMQLQRRLTPEFLTSKHHKLRHARCVITEDSLSSEALQHLSSTYNPTMLVCSKSNRVRRYQPFLNQFNGLVVNLETAWLILEETGAPPTDDASVISITGRLRTRVGGPVLLCYGSSQFSYTDMHHVILCSYSSPLTNASLYSHYRDTVAAGFFHCLLEGIKGEDLLKFVSACRDIVSQSPSLVNQNICPELIASVTASKHFQIRHSPRY